MGALKYYDTNTGTWVYAARGVQGPAGPTGPAGPNGATMRNGAGVPSNGLGANGDYYINTLTNNLYFKASGTYSVVANLTGVPLPFVQIYDTPQANSHVVHNLGTKYVSVVFFYESSTDSGATWVPDSSGYTVLKQYGVIDDNTIDLRAVPAAGGPDLTSDIGGTPPNLFRVTVAVLPAGVQGPTGPAGPAGGGSGDVVGPASATDNAVVRYDGTTGKLVQGTTEVSIADNGILALGPLETTPPISSARLRIADNDGSLSDMSFTSYGTGYGEFALGSSDGTAATPVAFAGSSTNRLGKISFRGYISSGWQTMAMITASKTTIANGTNYFGRLDFYLDGTGTTSALEIAPGSSNAANINNFVLYPDKAGNTPTFGISANTSDANVGLNIQTIGTGRLKSNFVNIPTVSSTDTLTNKTLTAPVIATIVNTGTLTLPTATDTLVGRATSDALTNKSLSGSTVAMTGAITSSGGGIGYATGAGGTVTQATSRTTGVTLSKLSGRITLFSTTLAADTDVSFTWTNTFLAATDVVVFNVVGGAAVKAGYSVNAICAAGSATVTVHNVTPTVTATEAPVIQFAVIKAVTA